MSEDREEMPRDRDEALCTLEYINRHNIRSHLCFSCCQCDALDRVGDSISRGEAPSEDMLHDLQDDVLDRLRIPAFGGARKLDLSYIIPNAFIGAVLYLGSLHFALAVMSPLFLMIGVNVLYKAWRRGRVSGRLFRSAIPSILLWVYSVSILLLSPTCSYEVIAVTHIGFILLAYCIWQTQASDPGIVQPTYSLTSSEGHPVALPVDACNKCGAIEYELSRHCRFCNHCVRRYDHHCVWLNCCVAAKNQRWFIGALFLLIAMSYAYLVYALRADCLSYPGISDTDKAIWYKGACLHSAYTHLRSSWLLVTGVTVALLLLGMHAMLLQQILMISADLTYLQSVRSSRDGNGCCWLVQRYTPRRIVRSWRLLLTGWPNTLPSHPV